MLPSATQQYPGPAPQAGQVLYFAYGSNLSFEQMTRRCPQSRYVGRARLYKYKFQINDCGFSNIISVPDLEAFVDGLCYRLPKADEAMLDRAEDVPTTYQKRELEVEFFPAPPSLIGRDVTDIIRYRDSYALAPDSSSSHDRHSMAQRVTSETRGITARAMVYLSIKYVNPGRPWDEYIRRMDSGLRGALRMGISNTYVEKDVRPWLMAGRGTREVKHVRFSSRKLKKTQSHLDTSSRRDRVKGEGHISRDTQGQKEVSRRRRHRHRSP